jgi:glucose/arabinose dehydrogenase
MWAGIDSPHLEVSLQVLLLAVVVLMALWQPGAPAPAAPDVEVLAANLDVPWSIAFSPDGRIFITERPGRIRVMESGRLLPQPYLILDDVDDEGESGLLGLALHPEFPRRPWLYVYYTYRSGRTYNRVVRIVERNGRPWTRTVFLNSIPSFVYHDGGRMKFGPDGKLYIATGYGEWPISAQRMDSLAGKILRLNDDGSIPSDNPFPGSPIYSYGHRNVQGLAWHPALARLYATEHGPTGEDGLCCRDEINLVEAGKNYGWPHVAGMGEDERFVNPLLSSGTEERWGPAGATFVTQALWRNSLLFAALRGRHVRRLTFDPTGRRVTAQEVLLPWRFGRLRDVAEGPGGAIYVLTSNRDGRGMPVPDDDRVLRFRLPTLEGAQ